MKTLFSPLGIVAILLVGIQAKAEIFTCNFTEPFVTVKADSLAKTMAITALGETEFNKDGSEKATFDIIDGKNGILRVSNLTKTLTLTINLVERGNDGMSDKVYDQDVILDTTGIEKLRGGCDSVK